MKRLIPVSVILVAVMAILIAQELSGQFQLNAQKPTKEEKKSTILENAIKVFNVTDTNGVNYKAEDLKDKIIILNFWASWCAPCVEEFKSMNKFLNTVDKNKVILLGINQDVEPLAKVKKIITKTVQKYELQFPNVTDHDEKISEKFLVEKIPTTMVFKNDKLVFMQAEQLDFQEKKFKNIIKDIL
jgi:thiol-disulfide isomerase/thioredoxin